MAVNKRLKDWANETTEPRGYAPQDSDEHGTEKIPVVEYMKSINHTIESDESFTGSSDDTQRIFNMQSISEFQAIKDTLANLAGASVSIIGDPLPQALPSVLDNATFTEVGTSTNIDILEVDSVDNQIIIKAESIYQYLTAVSVSNSSNQTRYLNFITRDVNTGEIYYSRYIPVPRLGSNIASIVSFEVTLAPSTVEILVRGADDPDDAADGNDNLTITSWDTSLYLVGSVAGGGGDSETAKRIEIQLTPQENIFAGDPLKVSSSSPTEIFVMRADVGENACYVAKQDYTSGDTEAIGVKVGGVIALDTSGAASDAPVYTAKGKGYTFTKTADYYQQVGTVARVGGNDGVICVSILELHENDVKEIVTGEAIAAEKFCAINGNDGKAYIVTSANSNGLAKNEIYFAVTGGAIGETIQITASKYKVTGATGTANSPYYIGSDGFKTATVPSTSGSIVRKVGTYAQGVFTVNIDKTFFGVS